jgi:hypothetical protein
MPKIDSTAITRIGYDAANRVLSVWFRDSGLRYDYFDVPREEYDAFLAASSRGAYFSANIRDRYRTERIGERRWR